MFTIPQLTFVSLLLGIIIGIMIGMTLTIPSDESMVEYFKEIKVVCIDDNQICYEIKRLY